MFDLNLNTEDYLNIIAVKLAVIPIAIAKNKGYLTVAYVFTFSMSVNLVSFILKLA